MRTIKINTFFVNYRLFLVNFRLFLVNYRLFLVNYRLFLVNYRLFWINYCLFLVNYRLFWINYRLFWVNYRIFLSYFCKIIIKIIRMLVLVMKTFKSTKRIKLILYKKFKSSNFYPWFWSMRDRRSVNRITHSAHSKVFNFIFLFFRSLTSIPQSRLQLSGGCWMITVMTLCASSSQLSSKIRFSIVKYFYKKNIFINIFLFFFLT